MDDPTLPEEYPEPPASDEFFGSFPAITVLSLALGLFLSYQFGLSLLHTIEFDVYGSVLIAVSVCYFAVPAFFLSRHRTPVLSTLRVGRLPLTQLLWLTLLTLCLLPAVEVLSQINTRFVPVPESFEQFLDELQPVGSLGWAKAILTLVILAPLGEEILFRGLMQQAARSAIGARPSALGVGLLFALAHGEPWYLLALVLVGLTLAFVFERTGSLTACMYVHALYNGVGLWMGSLLRDRDLGVAEPVMASTAAIGLGIAVLAYSQLKNVEEWTLEPPEGDEP